MTAHDELAAKRKHEFELAAILDFIKPELHFLDMIEEVLT